MPRLTVCLLVFFAVCTGLAQAQDKVVIVPKSIAGAPFVVEDSTDLFAKSYRFFIEGDIEMAADSLRKLIAQSNYQINPKAYYIVVANFTDRVSPIGPSATTSPARTSSCCRSDASASAASFVCM